MTAGPKDRRRCLPAVFVILLVLAALVRPASAGGFDHGLLWKIEGAAARPSYLFGTIHSEDPRVTRLAAPVARAFEQASRVTLEVPLDSATLVSLSAAMMFTDGRGLQAVVGDRLYRRAVQAMAGYSMPELLVAQMKPWAVATTLMVPEPTTGVMLDIMLYQRAVSAGKQVDGLETVDEQISIFDDMTDAQQVTLLEDTLANLSNIGRQNDALLAAYLQRDLGRLMELNEQSMNMGDRRLADTLNKRAIVERNHRMAERMESRLRQGNAFIAVGALHLPGPEGLLSLLKQKGYRVSVVY